MPPKIPAAGGTGTAQPDRRPPTHPGLTARGGALTKKRITISHKIPMELLLQSPPEGQRPENMPAQGTALGVPGQQHQSSPEGAAQTAEALLGVAQRKIKGEETKDEGGYARRSEKIIGTQWILGVFCSQLPPGYHPAEYYE